MCTYTLEIPITYWKGLRSFAQDVAFAFWMYQTLASIYIRLWSCKLCKVSDRHAGRHASIGGRLETDKVIEMTLNKDTKTPGKLSVYLNWIICRTHILGKIVSLCFKIRSVCGYIPLFYSYVILTKAFIWELK